MMKWLLIVPAALYLVVVGLVYVFQRSLMYSPGSSVVSPTVAGVPEMKPVTVKTDDGLSIEGWHAEGDANAPTIVLFHGNAGTVADRAFKARIFLDAGYGVVLAGYRGFGLNPGKPGEQGLYSDARAILGYLGENAIGTKDIVLYGESLGSGVAVQMAYELARKQNPFDTGVFRLSGLVLEAPFTSMGDAAASHYPWLPARLLVWDRFDSIDKIGETASPLLVIHGRRDRTVPFQQGVTLYDSGNGPKEALWLDEAAHANVYDFGAGEAIVSWLDRVSGNR